MDFHGDGGSMNHTNLIEYIKNQLPGELTTLVNLQAELAVRQGALSAAQDAIADRETAKQILADAKNQADTLVSQAKEKLDKAKAKEQALNETQTALNEAQATFASKSEKQQTVLDAQEKQLANKANSLNLQQEKLTADAATLAQNQTTLDARVQAFQDKVAALRA